MFYSEPVVIFITLPKRVSYKFVFKWQRA